MKTIARLPEFNQLDRNFCSVNLGGNLTVWFSYETMVAFYLRDSDELYVSENIWSKTTGKHLNSISSNKEERLSYSEFVAKWEELQK